ncbi:DUF1206 domain-containing protein [Streptomyces racemochromogenes]|uniref:DUF1206 domain-containing protein n=1 Tax=Streptomyces racemochromogenes TaxID=67353 RepID=UPI0031E96D3F
MQSTSGGTPVQDGAPRTGIVVAARVGLATRGVLYVLVGAIALRIAFGEDTGRQADRQGALAGLASAPLGQVMIWAVGIGLVGMTLWRLSEAVFGGAGPDGKKAGKRLAGAFRAVFYAVAAVSVFAFAAGQGGGGSGDEQSRDATASVLEWPGGRWLVALAGLGVAVGGVVIAVSALRRKFRDDLALPSWPGWVRGVVDVLGIGGGLARGALFAAAGGCAFYAAVDYDPDKAKGVDDTLRAFAGTPAGPWLLVAVAAGLVLFGLFSWAAAAWQRV